MITIAITPEIKNEINESIAQFNKLIEREMNISSDLRYHHKVDMYQNKVAELQQAITNGYI